MSRHVLSLRARADLRHIRNHIAKDNPSRAISFIEELTLLFERLAGMPMMGRIRDDLNRASLRSFVHGEYVVFYRPAPDGVSIVRVLHGKRRLESLL